MLRISEVSKLRLVIPVPESAASHIAVGQPVAFTVPAHGTRKFVGKMERISHNVDAKTRTMIVEADVDNVSGELEPGMYPEVAMHVEHREPSLTVPTSAIKEVEGKCVVMRMNNGVAQPVEVICRQSVGDSTVVFGALQAGDYVALAPGHASR
jgi:RND family efflux transporter MFP subunit